MRDANEFKNRYLQLLCTQCIFVCVFELYRACVKQNDVVTSQILTASFVYTSLVVCTHRESMY
jgi:hypothetical protein